MKIGKVEKLINEEVDANGCIFLPLIDPCDYETPDVAIAVSEQIGKAGAQLILVGGSIGAQGALLDYTVKGIKEKTGLPVLLFPGNVASVTKYADALYFMSLVNSRNPYWITQAQSAASFVIKQMKLEPIPTAYIVTEPGGTVGWVGDVNLIPIKKPSIAATIALGMQYLGSRLIITDRGAGADGPLPESFVKTVSANLEVPYIAGGGIKTPEQAGKLAKAGANGLQVGSIFQEVPVEKTKELAEKFIKEIRTGGKQQ